VTPHAIEHMGEGGGYPTPPGSVPHTPWNLHEGRGRLLQRGGGGRIKAATRQTLLFQSSQT
jgi:hypothetical protein